MHGTQNIIRTLRPSPTEVKMPFFEVPADARWNAEHDAVEFSVILRPYAGTVRIGRRVFQRLLDHLRPRSGESRRFISSGPGSS
jgi:hypothetical protein